RSVPLAAIGDAAVPGAGGRGRIRVVTRIQHERGRVRGVGIGGAPRMFGLAGDGRAGLRGSTARAGTDAGTARALTRAADTLRPVFVPAVVHHAVLGRLFAAVVGAGANEAFVVAARRNGGDGRRAGGVLRTSESLG